MPNGHRKEFLKWSFQEMLNEHRKEFQKRCIASIEISFRYVEMLQRMFGGEYQFSILQIHILQIHPHGCTSSVYFKSTLMDAPTLYTPLAIGPTTDQFSILHYWSGASVHNRFIIYQNTVLFSGPSHKRWTHHWPDTVANCHCTICWSYTKLGTID